MIFYCKKCRCPRFCDAELVEKSPEEKYCAVITCKKCETIAARIYGTPGMNIKINIQAPPRPKISARNAEIFDAVVMEDRPMAHVAKEYGIGKARIKQIVCQVDRKSNRKLYRKITGDWYGATPLLDDLRANKDKWSSKK